MTVKRTTKEVHARLRWDPRVDATRATVGYTDHARGLVDVPLLEFVPDGRIPWHRVRRFSLDGRVVWDRGAGIDLLDELVASATPAARTAWDEGYATPVPVWRWDGAQWAADGAEPPAPPRAGLRALTWNVLEERIQPERTRPERRLRIVLDLLERADADLVALQEVSPALCARLLAEPWVRAGGYAASDGPPGTTLRPHGPLLLSRAPVRRCALRRDGRGERVLLAELADPACVVGVVHLPSGYARPDAAEARAGILDNLVRLGLPESGSALLLGDFNAQESGPDVAAHARTGLLDVWRALRPDEPGWTYEPLRNPIAALTSSSQLPARLDRVLVRGLRPTSIGLVGDRPLPPPDEGLAPSDHSGLVVELEAQADDGAAARPELAPRATLEGPVTLDDPSVVTSACVLLPPGELWPALEAVRAAHDRHHPRWPPHVTLLFGFVPEGRFELAARVAARALREVTPPVVTLAGTGAFEHARSRTVWLRPATERPGQLEALQAALAAAFPGCRAEHAFTPHLTLGQARAGEPTAWADGLAPATFVADRVALLARRGDEPFVVRRVVPVGPSGDVGPVLSGLEAALAAREPGAERARALARRVAGQVTEAALSADPGARVEVSGSHRLGVAGPADDLDLVLLAGAVAGGPPGRGLDPEALLLAVAAALEAQGAPVAVAGGARVPVLRARVDGLRVEVVAGRAASGDPAALALSDAAALEAAARGSAPGLEAWRLALRGLRAWASARDLRGGAWGLLSGPALAVVAAWAAQQEPPGTVAGGPPGSGAGRVLLRALDGLATWPWPRPLALAGAPHFELRRSDRAPILAPSAPARDLGAHATPSTWAAVVDEAARGAALVRAALETLDGDGAGWDPLLAPRLAPSGLALAVTLDGPDPVGEAGGRLAARVVRAVLALEAGGCSVRPSPRGWRLELDREPDPETLAKAIGHLADHPPADGRSRAAPRLDARLGGSV